MEQHLKLNIKY